VQTDYNTALSMNTKMHIIHDNLKYLSELEKGKTKEMEENNDPKSEKKDLKKFGICPSQKKKIPLSKTYVKT